jgi:hypothetical protein
MQKAVQFYRWELQVGTESRVRVRTQVVRREFFLFWPLLPTHCGCRGLLLNLITLSDTDTFGGTPLDEGSACRRYRYLYNTQHSQETDHPPPHATDRIRTPNPSKSATADPRLKPRGHCDRPMWDLWCKKWNIRFSPSTSFLSCQYHSTNAPYSFIHRSLTLCNLFNWQHVKQRTYEN